MSVEAGELHIDRSRAAAAPDRAGLPSRTCLWVAAARALGSRDPDPSVRNPDWLAAHLLGPEERACLAGEAIVEALEQDYRAALENEHVASLVQYHMQRTRFVDACLHAAAATGLTQLVIVGAGFESRAYRLRERLRTVQVFEIDRSTTQAWKCRAVARVFGAPPANVAYVPATLGVDSLIERLRGAGYQIGRATFFIVEGVSMYVPEPLMREVLRLVAQTAAPGSAVAFDLWTREQIVKGPELSPVVRDAADKAASWGEPWIFGVPGGREHAFVASCGLTLVEKLALKGDEAIARYLTRRDGSTVGNVRRSSAPPPLGHAGQWLALARVPDVAR